MKQTINIIIASLLIVMAACSGNKHREEVCGFEFGSSKKEVAAILEKKGFYAPESDDPFELFAMTTTNQGIKYGGIEWGLFHAKFDKYNGLYHLALDLPLLDVIDTAQIHFLEKEILKEYGSPSGPGYNTITPDDDYCYNNTWTKAPVNVSLKMYDENSLATIEFVATERVFEK